MRVGGLIFAFFAEIYRLDPASMAEVDPADPDVDGGFDPDFREPRLEVAEGATVATPIRREMDPIRIPAQIEPEAWDALRVFDAGDSARSDLVLTMHYRDLRRLGLVDAETGLVTLRPGDRLGAIYDRSGVLVRTIRNPPGLYLDELRDESFGLSLRRPQRQILIASLRDRQQAVGAPS